MSWLYDRLADKIAERLVERYETILSRTRELEDALRAVGRREAAMRVLDTSSFYDGDRRPLGARGTVGEWVRSLVKVETPMFLGTWGREYAARRDAGLEAEPPGELRSVSTRPPEASPETHALVVAAFNSLSPIVAPRPGDDDPVMQAAWDALNVSGFVVAPEDA